jgi:hypothetical protein
MALLNNMLEKVCAEMVTIMAIDTGVQPASRLVWTLPLCSLYWCLGKTEHSDMIY